MYIDNQLSSGLKNQGGVTPPTSRHPQASRFYPLPHSTLAEFHFGHGGWSQPQQFSALLSEAPAPAVLPGAGLKTTMLIDGKTLPLIQSALEQSTVLRAFIPQKLRPITIVKSFVLHGSDAEFNGRYIKLSKIVVPFGSKEEKELLNIRGFYHRATDSIHLRPSSTVGLAVRLAIHKLSSPGFLPFFGKSIDEGLSLYFANLVLAEQGLDQTNPEQYRDQLHCATNLIALAGINMVGKAYFENHNDLLRHLTTTLSIGPVGPAELANDALCTAKFDSFKLFQLRCRKFLKDYELSFNPGSVKFGVSNNAKLTTLEKDQRKREVLDVIGPLRGRLSARAAAALDGKVPIFSALPPSLVTTAIRLADIQFNLFREWFPVGNSVQFNAVQDCFEQFANGELRDPSEVGHPGLFEPDSAAFFLFAEFAFLCRELRHKESFWLPVLRTFVKTQEIFMHAYRNNPKSPPPPVNALLPAPGGPRRSLDAFEFTNFKQIGSSVAIGEGQSDLKRKLALRAKYDRMDDAQLKAAARDNLRRAQLMS